MNVKREETEKKMVAFEMSCNKSIWKIKWVVRITNEEVLDTITINRTLRRKSSQMIGRTLKHDGWVEEVG